MCRPLGISRYCWLVPEAGQVPFRPCPLKTPALPSRAATTPEAHSGGDDKAISIANLHSDTEVKTPGVMMNKLSEMF